MFGIIRVLNLSFFQDDRKENYMGAVFGIHLAARLADFDTKILMTPSLRWYA